MMRARVWLNGARLRGVAIGGLISVLAGAGGCGDDASGSSGTAGATGSSGRGGASAGGSGGTNAGGSGGGVAGSGGGAGTSAGGSGGGVAGSGGGAGTGGRGGAGGVAGTGGVGGRGGAAGAAGAGGTGGAAIVNEMEPNDTTATANDFAAIAVNGRVSAAIGVAGDNDYFAVTVPAGATALYVTTFSSGVDTTCATANTTLSLIGTDGTTLLASNTNISPTQLCSHVSYAPAPGTYFVRITGNSSSSTFAYVLAVRIETLPAATPETEPNEDGTPSTGNGMGNFEGNDFSIDSANGPYSADTLLSGALMPVGDEDVFAIRNQGTSPAEVYLETFNGGFGACTNSLDTQIRIRDASGTVLAFNDDATMGRTCSFLPYVIPAGATVYAHVIDFGDNTAAPAYSLHISFP